MWWGQNGVQWNKFGCQGIHGHKKLPISLNLVDLEDPGLRGNSGLEKLPGNEKKQSVLE